jgi:hypothetical protein
MSTTLRQRAHGEEGIALIAVLLLLMMISGLGAALVTGSTTEALVARNYKYAAEARAAADAGLNHAIEVTIANLQNWRGQGFASRSAAVTAMIQGPDRQSGSTTSNADNGSLESLGIPRPPARLTIGTGSYEARVFDEDDPARGVVLSAADQTRILEDGLRFADANTTLVVRATGYGRAKTTVVLEAAISRSALPGILTNRSLLINGSPNILGTRGSVHSNQNLDITGNPSVAQDATASATYQATGNPWVGGLSGGAFEAKTVPPVQAADYRQRADYILGADGRLSTADNAVTKVKGKLICNAQANQNACKNSGFAWTYAAATGWSLGDNSVPPVATYYVETDVSISGSPGSSSSPVQLSIIAEGSIDVGGSPFFVPKDAELMFVTNEDLRIIGNLTVAAEGLMLVREQVSVAGSAAIAGQLVVEGAASISPLVTANSISGNSSFTYNGIVSAGGFGVTAWRRVR